MHTLIHIDSNFLRAQVSTTDKYTNVKNYEFRILTTNATVVAATSHHTAANNEASPLSYANMRDSLCNIFEATKCDISRVMHQWFSTIPKHGKFAIKIR